MADLATAGATMSDLLTQNIVALVDEARSRATDEAIGAEVEVIKSRLEGPLRLAIAGKVKAGKSTLLNAMLGEDLAPTDAGECTRILTWYQLSHRTYAKVHPLSGDPVERPYRRTSRGLQVDLGGLTAEQVDHIEVGWPTSKLRGLTLIDTPGIASISTDVSARTHHALSAEEGKVPVADAVIYLLRHTHASDLRFLESFHDDEIAQGTAINTLGVLSRADEIGSCRRDAMEVAARVASRYAGDVRLRRLCPVVVPVNGLLGFAGVTLRESEFAELSAIANSPPDTLESLLLTADRFVTSRVSIGVPPEARSRLLERVGLYGVRICVQMLRNGAVKDSTAMSRSLVKTSGLDRLLVLLTHQFEERTRLLKARSAVSALEDLFLRDGAFRDLPYLRGRLEEITVSAHEFDEIRLLFDLRSGDIALDEDRTADLDRLLGGSGHDPATRLGLAPEASDEDIRSEALRALATWRSVSEHPLSRRSAQIAARTATRTLEGLLMATSTGAPDDDQQI